jgi:Fe2+ transport system protein B
MKSSEIVKGIVDLLNLSKEKEVVELSETKEEVVEEAVELAEDKPTEEPKKEDSVKSEANQVIANFATQEQLSQVKMELLEMIKSIIEDKSTVGEKEVPQELSAEKVELETVEEIVHSPESEVEKKNVVLFENKQPSTVQERVNQMLFNK